MYKKHVSMRHANGTIERLRDNREEIYKTVRSMREPSETPTIIAPQPTHSLSRSQKESIYGTLKKRSKTSDDIYAQLWTVPKDSKLNNNNKDKVKKNVQTPCYYDIYEDPNKIKERLAKKKLAASKSNTEDTTKTSVTKADSDDEDTASIIRKMSGPNTQAGRQRRGKSSDYISKSSKNLELTNNKYYDTDTADFKKKLASTSSLGKDGNYKDLAKDFESLLIKKENELRLIKVRNNEKVNECKAKINYLADKVRDQRKELTEKERKINAKRKQINELLDKTDKLKREQKSRKSRSRSRTRSRDRNRDRDRSPKDNNNNRVNQIIIDNKEEINELHIKLEMAEDEKEQVQSLSNQKLDIAAKKIKELVMQVKTMHENYEELNNENHELKLNEIKLIKTISQLKSVLEQQQMMYEGEQGGREVHAQGDRRSIGRHNASIPEEDEEIIEEDSQATHKSRESNNSGQSGQSQSRHYREKDQDSNHNGEREYLRTKREEDEDEMTLQILRAHEAERQRVDRELEQEMDRLAIEAIQKEKEAQRRQDENTMINQIDDAISEADSFINTSQSSNTNHPSQHPLAQSQYGNTNRDSMQSSHSQRDRESLREINSNDQLRTQVFNYSQENLQIVHSENEDEHTLIENDDRFGEEGQDTVIDIRQHAHGYVASKSTMGDADSIHSEVLFLGGSNFTNGPFAYRGRPVKNFRPTSSLSEAPSQKSNYYNSMSLDRRSIKSSTKSQAYDSKSLDRRSLRKSNNVPSIENHSSNLSELQEIDLDVKSRHH